MPARPRRHRHRPPPVPKSPRPFDAETWARVVAKLRLPPQQARVAELLLLDKGNKEIADAMGIGEPTVCTYLTRLFDSLGVGTRLAFVLRLVALVREGWDRADDDVIGTDDIGTGGNVAPVMQRQAFETGKKP